MSNKTSDGVERVHDIEEMIEDLKWRRYTMDAWWENGFGYVDVHPDYEHWFRGFIDGHGFELLGSEELGDVVRLEFGAEGFDV